MSARTIPLLPPGYPPEITGYVEPWIASPGEQIDLKVSSTEKDLQYRVVRLIHGPQGDNFDDMTQETIADIPHGKFTGRYQVASPGSYAVIPQRDYGIGQDGVNIALYFQAHLVEEATHIQTILSTLDVLSKSGFAAVLTEQGYVEFWIGTGPSIEVVPTSFKPIVKEWTGLNFTIQANTVSFKLTPIPSFCQKVRSPVMGSVTLAENAKIQRSCILTFAASYAESSNQKSKKPVNFFNGRIGGPELRSSSSEGPILAKWDFALAMTTETIIDISGNGAEGHLVQAPTRAVSGHDWNGAESDWTKSINGYDAVHFHEDDLDDAAWETDLSLSLPSTLRSGAYAVVVEARGLSLKDSIPFFVRPTHLTSSALGAKVAYILSTLTYLAYGNEHVYDRTHLQPETYPWVVKRDEHAYKTERRVDVGLSCYDVHNDRSGVIHSSSKRPILNMRPDYLSWNLHRPRGLSADLILMEFLERSGIPYDVVTDHDLHVGGAGALQRYQTVLTGSHPEYHTVESLFAYSNYVKAGGNLMYLGGNGFYWSCAIPSGNLHRVEIRRGDQGVRSFTMPGGDRVFSANGQLGLLWRTRGLAANRLVGVGCCAGGSGPGVPYKRTDAGRDPQFSWMFQGIAEDELLGTEGFGGGASGDEVDKCDYGVGSPPNTLVVATSVGHPDQFGIFPEEVEYPMLKTVGTQTNEIRSDITYYEAGGGGAVFSVGSINWLNSLGWNHFQNNVATLTANVLREFVRRHR
ncbi:hypothetical protein AbraIFM66951_000489 [Aspergillus brasiliensis]|uniref:N,N-dimethylformamidase beta subunit-like C-terminal domain-containing protein n=1 Tax=Aspergillus brasiliensis TaxID=319629 RepID=A0A9W6DRE4_9EURO|nr:hypothetical protein AbraCBS73388_011988 [Aspergillus brasiliensis]GKZ48428.1 hypothetical protein AbraIFM66951_000489 [Aspergillus brasiliensis]